MTIILKSNRIVLPESIRPGYITIVDDKILEVTESIEPNAQHTLLDFTDSVIMPGIIDPHVHINEPGRTEWEGFDTATRAAIAGGITTLVDMPLNSSPVTTNCGAFDAKIASAKNQLHCNVGFWGGIVPGNENEIEGLIKKGVLGFKAFLCHSGIDEFPNVTEADLRKVMPIIARHNLPLLVHCELTDTIQRTEIGKERSYKNYLASRPPKWEENAISLMIRLCEVFNCRVHIVHLSSASSLRQIEKARANGLKLTVETGQHYLYFNAEEIQDGKTEFKCAPPIRSKENNERLWNALEQGTIDFVATDHSPCIPVLKELDSGDFLKAWGGIASIQFALPVLWTAANKRGIGLQQIARWLSQEPAKLIGKQHLKGKIEKGYDADLVVWNPEASFTVTESIILHRHKVTPYLHQRLKGKVVGTFLSGLNVYKGSTLLQSNFGRIIKPTGNEE